MSDGPIERLDEQREADIALRLNRGSDPIVFDEAEAASLLRIIRRLRRLIERLAWERDDATRARPAAEWHEDIGPVLWWFFPISEPPYVGTPNDDHWPGYHTHWTPIPLASDGGER